ncbi:MAG: hypothetical protein M1828_004892 [Chrysothrix sp. TS-e1954]|nr:MAG: hypothetical protein M1828_004892 [Chrysothrix sp. TS-e1954]
MSKIDRTIARQKQKIEEGQFYEAHQQLRVIASRYVKQSNYDAAIGILFNGAQLLLQAGQGGSGGDLCVYLLDVYKQAEVKPDAASKGKLLTLLRAYPKREPTRKRFVTEMTGWSAKFGEYPAGDPELHHVAGQLLADDDEPYEAERHLTLGTRDSTQLLAHLEYTWYTQDSPHTAGQYAARAIFPLLLIGNLRAANQFFLLFTTRLSQSNTSLAVQQVSSQSCDMRVYPSLPALNFLSLLLMAIQRGSAELYKGLLGHYKAQIEEADGAWDEALARIAEMYFGIRPPKQGNPLMDMMSNMFGGGGGAAAKPKPQRVEAPAPPPALD